MTATEIIPGQLWHFRLFSAAECKDMLRRIDAQRDERDGAPNTMNRYGAFVGGQLRPLLAELSLKHVQQFAPYGMRLKKYPYAFAIDYSTETQKGLKTHVDTSDMTLNVCLGTKFKGGNLICYPDKGAAVEVEQRVGYAVVHRGSLAHRAAPLTAGQRTNLVLWCTARKTGAVRCAS